MTDASEQGDGLPDSRLWIRASGPLWWSQRALAHNPAIIMLLSLPGAWPRISLIPFPRDYVGWDWNTGSALELLQALCKQERGGR